MKFRMQRFYTYPEIKTKKLYKVEVNKNEK